MNPKRFPILLTALLIAVTGLLVPAASAQVVPKSVAALTLSATTVAANTTSTITSGSFTANKDSGFAVLPKFVLSGTGVSNVTFNFQASTDGTTWTTTTPVSYAVAANGTNSVVGFFNVPSALSGTGAANVRYWRLGSVTNANTPSTLTINSITISKDNP